VLHHLIWSSRCIVLVLCVWLVDHTVQVLNNGSQRQVIIIIIIIKGIYIAQVRKGHKCARSQRQAKQTSQKNLLRGHTHTYA